MDLLRLGEISLGDGRSRDGEATDLVHKSWVRGHHLRAMGGTVRYPEPQRKGLCAA